MAVDVVRAKAIKFVCVSCSVVCALGVQTRLRGCAEYAHTHPRNIGGFRSA